MLCDSLFQHEMVDVLISWANSSMTARKLSNLTASRCHSNCSDSGPWDTKRVVNGKVTLFKWSLYPKDFMW